MAAHAPNHPVHAVSRVVMELRHRVAEVADSSVWSMPRDEAATTLQGLTRLAAQIGELELRVAAQADALEVGVDDGATSTANWWAHTTRQTRVGTHRKLRLAHALAEGHAPVREALTDGDLGLEAARVIVDAVAALPADLDPALVARAEAHLVAEAHHHDPKALKILGRRLLEVVAPDRADAHEARLLDAEERAAAAKTRFTMSDDGRGASHGRFTLPTVQADMLRKALLALAAPKHRAATDGAEGPATPRRPGPERMGRAFCEYLERYPTDRLPHAGGVAATVVVTIPLDTLHGANRAGQLDTGVRISPGQARRLACEAGLIPAVLGGPSVVLDLGRRTRLHTEPQRIAITLRDGGCTAEGCDWPPGMCHTHHNDPWSRGGPTDTRNARLLCPRHHARAHDPAFKTTELPAGKVAFTRRT